MGLGRQGEQQGTMYLAWDEIPRSRGHAFYDRLQQILRKAGFDAFAEKLCKPFYSDLQKTLEAAQKSLRRVTPTPPCPDDPAELVADKGYFSRDVLKDLDGGPWRTRIAEPKRNGLNSWRGDHEARRAVYNNRIRISSMVGKAMGKRRTELVERSFEHTLDRSGGMRRVWLRGRENI